MHDYDTLAGRLPYIFRHLRLEPQIRLTREQGRATATAQQQQTVEHRFSEIEQQFVFLEERLSQIEAASNSLTTEVRGSRESDVLLTHASLLSTPGTEGVV